MEKSGVTVTVNNVVQLSPMEVWESLSALYDNVKVPEEAVGPEDLNHISELMGWSMNQRAYLSSLSAFVEIETKRINRTGTKTEYSDMVSKKTTIKTYLDVLKGIYDTSSRQLTIYQTQHDEAFKNSKAYNI